MVKWAKFIHILSLCVLSIKKLWVKIRVRGLQDAGVAHLTVGGPHGRTGPGNIFSFSHNNYPWYGLPFEGSLDSCGISKTELTSEDLC